MILLKANTTVLTDEVCTSKWGSNYIAADMLCATDTLTSTCQVRSLTPVVSRID